jgi:membrane peptidoglycan carboxypeptidase
MNYGDPNDPPKGRAQVPGSPDPAGGYPASGGYNPSGGYGTGGYGDDGYDAAGGSSAGYGADSTGRGSAGRGTVGRASVSGGAAAGSYSTSGEPSGSISGRASVPPAGGGGAAGRATVGRASVRSSTPMGDMYDGDILEGGPGTAPPGGPPPGARPPKSASSRAKRRRRRNVIIVGIAAFIMLAGVGMVSGTYYFDKVALPQDLKMKESTTIYYSNGQVMAKIGEENRTMITIGEVPLDVQHAVVATEDNSFYTNGGVDYKGVARAAWNNVTGGGRQGASTISQQYARHWADLTGVTYGRKLREAVIAMKLNKQYSKDKIMEMYLNIVYFGRGAYGIEAAAEAYFNKQAKQLTMAEGMVLAGIIKQPEGSGGKGSPYDGTVDPQKAQDRFNNYIKPNMLKLGFVNQQQYDAMKYPDTVVKVDPNNNTRLRAQWGLDKPEGLIVHHVMDELSKIKNADNSLKFADPTGNIENGIRNGGLKIVTTVDQTMQADAMKAAGGGPGTPMAGQPANLQAALVSVEPGTGRVRAYYGGADGSGNDYASFYNDPVLAPKKGDSCCGGHPPGSSFKIYDLTAALISGYSVNSYWNGNSPIEFPNSGRVKPNPVKNAGDGGGGPGKCIGGAEHCQLWEAAEQSLNTPFFALGEAVTPAKILDAAKSAGLRYMWASVNNVSVRKDLTTGKGSDFAPKYFQTEMAIGQYPITVLDHANGTATLAARGMASDVHFVQEVSIDGKKVYGEKMAAKRIPGFTEGMADDLDWVLQKIPVAHHQPLANGVQSAGKTGTWQLGNATDANAHAWMIGYTAADASKKSPGVATAVWVGNKGNEQPIRTNGGKNIAGATLPGPIWQMFMNSAIKDTKMPKVDFGKPKFVGDKEQGNAASPAPPPPPPDQGNNNPGGGLPFSPPPGTTTSPPGGGNGGGGGGGIPTPTFTRRN